MKTTKLHH